MAVLTKKKITVVKPPASPASRPMNPGGVLPVGAWGGPYGKERPSGGYVPDTRTTTKPLPNIIGATIGGQKIAPPPVGLQTNAQRVKALQAGKKFKSPPTRPGALKVKKLGLKKKAPGRRVHLLKKNM